MISGAPWRVFLAAEGTSDLRRIRTLFDYFLQKHAGGDVPVDQLRRFEGLDGERSHGGIPFIEVKRIPQLARARGLDRRFSPGGPKKGDGGTLRRLYQVLKKDGLLDSRSVILWVRDTDEQPWRREEAKAAKSELPPSPPLLLAIATECGEAWVIAGWRPSDRDRKLLVWRKKLPWGPRARPWELSHKRDAPKSAKAVLRDIFEEDEEREAAALIEAAESGSEASRMSGLHEFRVELEELLSQA
jgi:hypothetical protein